VVPSEGLMKRPFVIKEIKSRIFLFEFRDVYDMCMYFLRYQEFYESPSRRFRENSFEIFDFMRWYSKKYGKGSFSYPNDWDGFNIPSTVIWKMWNEHLIPDKNIYDYEMWMAWQECNAKLNKDVACPTKPINQFYIIGVKKGNSALSHEIAHGLFYLYPEYRKEMTKLVKAIDPDIRKIINAGLKKLGYTPKVYIDETQAYMATGLNKAFGEDTKQWAKERKVFRDFFKKFSKEVK